MRESVFSFPSQGRACVCISSALYDRRAIDAPSPSLPLINSLTHLSYLTATSPRIREILSLDGGIERLVKILKSCAEFHKTVDSSSNISPFKPFNQYSSSYTPTITPTDRLLLYTYTLAFQCVVNIGVRGSETIRTRVVEAGALDVVIQVLETYLVEINKKKSLAEIAYKSRNLIGQRMEINGTVVSYNRTELDSLDSITITTPNSEDNTTTDESASSSGQEQDIEPEDPSTSRTRRVREGKEVEIVLVESDVVDRDGDSLMDSTIDAQPTPTAVPRSIEDFTPTTSPPATSIASTSTLSTGLQYRDEDVLLSLQLLAYLSKYPHVRSVFHSPADDCDEHDSDLEDDPAESHDHTDCANECTLESLPRRSNSTKPPPQLTEFPSLTPTLSSNIFSLVESFTHRPPSSDKFTPRHSNEVQYWAGVIMRNACRKDESRGGIRQCANMLCGIWEKFPREFAKCRRCRKAKYCSKGCQSKAWQFGHRYWCAKAAPKEVVPGSGEAGEAVEELEGESREREIRGGSSRGVTPTNSLRPPRLGRVNGYHLSLSRPSTAGSMDTEEEDELRLPPIRTNLPTPLSALPIIGTGIGRAGRNSIPNLPRGLENFTTGNNVEIEEVMNENQVAEEMLVGGGRVFGGGVGVMDE